MFSQDEKDEIQITNVTVKGNLATSKNTIMFTAGLRKGQKVSISDFPRAVKRLWQLGLFKQLPGSWHSGLLQGSLSIHAPSAHGSTQSGGSHHLDYAQNIHQTTLDPSSYPFDFMEI